MDHINDWSDQEDVQENEERYQEDITESEGDHDELDYDIDIEMDESEYTDECAVNIADFDIIKKLGTGAYGTVFLVKKNCGIDVDKIYALKVIDKVVVVEVPKTIVHMRAERKALEILRTCPYIQKLYYAFQTGDKLFLVTEYLPGGEMFTLLQKGALQESQVRFYMAELIVALEHIHLHGIVYRDIKLENIMLDADGHIKLVDFGLCKKLGARGRSKSFCGTEEYMAPEIIACTGHNTAADWWALGVLAIELLTTVTPFGTNDVPNAIMNRITNEPPIMPQDISEAMEDFLSKILIKDPVQRLGGSFASAKDIKLHRLFNDIDWEMLERKELPAPNAPTITHPYDTQNFSEEFTNQPACFEPSAVPANSFLTFKGYSYIAPEISDTQTKYHANSWIDENWNFYSNRDPDSKFHEKYRFASQSDQPIGVCIKCIKKSDSTVYAVKIFKRQTGTNYEIDILKAATAKRLPGVLHLVEVLTDSSWTYLVTEWIDGVNLLEHFRKVALNGRIAYKAFDALWTIVKSVHSLKYAHRRICFKNFCYLENSKEFRLIGFSKAEPITDEHDKRIDLWSLGVCIYTVMCGHPPFDSQTSALTSQIINNDFDQESDQWTALHKDLKCFIDQLLCTARPTCNRGELKKIINHSVQLVDFSQHQMDDNKKIIAIRAGQPTIIETELNHASNGVKKITNGNTPNDGAVDVNTTKLSTKYHSLSHESQSKQHSDINGHAKKKLPSKRRYNQTDVPKQEISNVNKKLKPNNPESMTAAEPLLKTDEIKVERELRKRPAQNYTQKVKLNIRASKATVKAGTTTKKEAENIEIPDKKAKKNQPKNNTNNVTNRIKGRPRKIQPNASERAHETRTTREIPTTHSVPPPNGSTTQSRTAVTSNATTIAPPPNGSRAQSRMSVTSNATTISSYTNPSSTKREGFVDQAAQTDSCWPSMSCNRKSDKRKPYYCFERINYD